MVFRSKQRVCLKKKDTFRLKSLIYKKIDVNHKTCNN